MNEQKPSEVKAMMELLQADNPTLKIGQLRILAIREIAKQKSIEKNVLKEVDKQ